MYTTASPLINGSMIVVFPAVVGVEDDVVVVVVVVDDKELSLSTEEQKSGLFTDDMHKTWVPSSDWISHDVSLGQLSAVIVIVMFMH